MALVVGGTTQAFGKVGQVVTTTFTGTESSTVNLASSDSYTTSSVAATLTPSASSSKILVQCTINAGSSSASNGCHIGRFLMAISGGATTAHFRGDAAGNRKRNSTGRMNEGTGGTTMHTYGFTFVLSPSTTSAVTVSYQFATRGSGGSETAYINRVHNDSDSVEHGRAASAITLTEILA